MIKRSIPLCFLILVACENNQAHLPLKQDRSDMMIDMMSEASPDLDEVEDITPDISRSSHQLKIISGHGKVSSPQFKATIFIGGVSQ